jgi:hypothetical protein
MRRLLDSIGTPTRCGMGQGASGHATMIEIGIMVEAIEVIMEVEATATRSGTTTTTIATTTGTATGMGIIVSSSNEMVRILLIPLTY